MAFLLGEGDDDMAAWALAQALQEQPRTAVFDDVVRGAMELVGWRWEHGKWTVAQEHLASVALAAALARIRPARAVDAVVGPVAVLAAPEGEHHVAGLACLAQVLEEHGWQVSNLGANVPTGDLVRFLADRDVQLVGLSIASEDHLPALQRALAAIGDEAGAPAGRRIVVGGRGVASAASRGAVPGADLVSTTLAEAARFAREIAATWTTASSD